MLSSILLFALGYAKQWVSANATLYAMVFVLMGGSVIQLQMVRSVHRVLDYDKGLKLQALISSITLLVWVILLVDVAIPSVVLILLLIMSVVQYGSMIVYLLTLGKGIKEQVEPCYSRLDLEVDASQETASLLEISNYIASLTRASVTCNTWEDVLYYVEKVRIK